MGALFIFSGILSGKRALAESTNSTPPPTAQFPSTEPGPVPTPTAPAQVPNQPTPPLPAALPPAPPLPPGAAPPPAPPAYPYPTAYSYEAPELVPIKPADSNEVFSLTISPLHLIFPIVQLTAEVRATPHFGVSVIAGYGTVTVDSVTPGGVGSAKVSAYEIGARLAGYPLKNFKSLQLGAQVLYLKVDSNGAVNDSNVSGTGAGVAFGPFVGYKLVTSVGFTFLAELGFQYLSAQAEAHDTSGNSDSGSDNRLLPLLNLDVGWSF